MDLLTIAIFAGAALLAIGVVAFMLNRAWGDFPGRVGPPTGSLPGGTSSSRPVQAADAAWLGEPIDPDEVPEPRYPAGAPEGSLIAVEHPLVRRAVEAAMEKGGNPYATYFIRHDDTIYVNLARIADPAQRERIASMLREVNGKGGGDMSMTDLMRAVQDLTRLR